MSETQVNLKLMPHVDGSLAIAQRVAYQLGPGRARHVCIWYRTSTRRWPTCRSSASSAVATSSPT